MKKTSLLLLLGLSLTCSLRAQTADEWLNQKKTQTQYLMQQIAGLQQYIGYARKGYGIIRDGLNTLGKLSRGEFTLHERYFNSLQTVNPTVKRYGRIAEIVALQVRIVKRYNATMKQLRTGSRFSKEELDYIAEVYQKVMEDCLSILELLSDITTDGVLAMKDNERIAGIDRLYKLMLENDAFCTGFGNDARSLAASRGREQRDIEQMRVLNGLQKQ